MKTLERMEKSLKNQANVLTKLLLSHIFLALEYLTNYQINGKTQAFKQMVGYAGYLIYIFMNIKH